MSQKEKAILRLLSLPKDFTFQELCTVLSYFGYEVSNRGATSGSAVMFRNPVNRETFKMHKPHPGNVIPPYALHKIVEYLKQEGLL